MLNEDNSRNHFIESVHHLKKEKGWGEGRIVEEFFAALEIMDLPDAVYIPSAELLQHLEEFKNNNDKLTPIKRGELLEKIVYLACACLEVTPTLESYRSYAHQHDLLVTGNSPLWNGLLFYIFRRDKGNSAILFESKNTGKAIPTEDFEKVCSILFNKFEELCHLGVIFASAGARGFPNKGRKNRQICLRDAWATQLIFHARTKKYVVVFDKEDILALSSRGSLPRILADKVLEVEKATGLNRIEKVDEEISLIPLPPHLEGLRST